MKLVGTPTWIGLACTAWLLAVTAFAQAPASKKTPIAKPRSSTEALPTPFEPEPLPEELSLIDSLPARETADDPWLDSETQEPVGADPDLALQLATPAPTVSSGFWLRDGLSYFEADVVLLERNMQVTTKLASDLSPNSERELNVGRGALGLAANARFTIGQFLLRDAQNRDHAIEFSFYGLGDWNDENSIAAGTDNFLASEIDPFIGGFNGADTQMYRYVSDYDSFELNYQLFHRLGRDQMVMQPGGDWVRKATPGALISLMAGLRVVKVDELFTYTSESTNPALRRGELFIRTNNDLVGFQFGGAWTQQRVNWNWGVRGKAGAYVNFTSQSSRLFTIDPVLLDLDRQERAERDSLAFVGELGVFGRYQIHPNFSARVGYELLAINQLALAPEQINFAPDPIAEVTLGGVAFCQGFSAGFELIW